jgi:hypothetical protein
LTSCSALSIIYVVVHVLRQKSMPRSRNFVPDLEEQVPKGWTPKLRLNIRSQQNSGQRL